MAHVVLDFHSGGKTLDFLPFAAAHALDDSRQEEECIAAVAAFGAPWSVKMREIDAVGMFDTTVEQLGKVFVTTELGGGGTATAQSASIAKRGTANLLRHAGILSGAIEERPTRWLDMPSDDCFTFSEIDGMMEPLVDLGDAVRKGQPIGRAWPIDRTGVAPYEYTAKMDGILAARHFPGLVKAGDCIAVLGVTD